MSEFDEEIHVPKPWVQVAIFCQNAIIEANSGSRSIIKNVDGVTMGGITSEMQPMQVQLTLALILKSGEMKGQYYLKVRYNSPGEVKTEGPSLPCYFEGGDRGLQTVIPLGFLATEPGIYWFDLLLDGQILTRMPVRVMYQQMQMQGIRGIVDPSGSAPQS
ncbi:MAG: hypothetical protein ABR910_16320 [Acidobacteriaceae bacterium]